MYFDTLKMSSIEQSANQVSARGGYKNAELITWDFGKEISVNITDALYTPASLSLLWGGKFGIKNAEINGFWNPIHYENKLINTLDYQINNNEDIQIKFKDFKEYLLIYEDYINKLYSKIQNDEDFLKPYIKITLYISIQSLEYIEYYLNPQEIYSLFYNEVPEITEENREIIINYLEQREHIDTSTYESISVVLQSIFDDNGVLKNYSYYATSLIKELDITEPDYFTYPYESGHPAPVPYDISWITNNFIYFLKAYAKGTVTNVDRRRFMNKEQYTYTNLVLGNYERIFCEIIKKYTNYKQIDNIHNIFPKEYLLSNYVIYQNNGQTYFKFITDEYNPAIRESYQYTSKYLGYNPEDIKYPYILNINEEPTQYNCTDFVPAPKQIGQPAERAKLIINNFSDFNMTLRKQGVQYNQYTVLHETGNNEEINFDNSLREVFYDYEWQDCEVQLLSLEGKNDIYYLKHIDILYRVNSKDFTCKILLKNHNENSYYNSQLDIKKNSNTQLIKVGTFYVNDSSNTDISPKNSIYPIQSGINDVYYLDRLNEYQAKQNFCINTDKNLIANAKKDLPQYKETDISIYLDPKTMKPYEPNATEFKCSSGKIIYGNLRVIRKGEHYYRFNRAAAKQGESLGKQIIINENSFPGNYKLVGHTHTRARIDGKDMSIQFEIPLCNITSSSSIELTSDGEPSIFNMTLKVLKNKEGEMLKIYQYDTELTKYENGKNSSENIKSEVINTNDTSCNICNNPTINIIYVAPQEGIEILMPIKDDYYCFPIDCLAPFNCSESYLILPKTKEKATQAYEAYEAYKEALNRPISEDYDVETKQQIVRQKRFLLDQYRDLLLIKAPMGGGYIYIDGELYSIAKTVDEKGNIISGGVNDTEDIDGQTYRVEIITQENIDKYSPIKFTIVGGE